MKVQRGRSGGGKYPPGDYPFQVITAEEHTQDDNQWMIVRILGTDPTDSKVRLHSILRLGNWDPKRWGGFYESVGIPANADVEATDLIGRTGMAYWALGEESTSESFAGQRFLEPTDCPGAPGGFYPRDFDDEHTNTDDYFSPPGGNDENDE